MAKACYYVESTGPREGAAKIAIAALAQWSQESGKAGLLIWPSLQNINDGVLPNVVGSAALKQFVKNRSIAFQGGGSMQLYTFSKIPPVWDGPVLVFYPSRKALDEADAIFSVTHMLVVPWSMDETESWRRTRSAINLATGAADIDDELDPILIEALKALTNRVNLSTGLGHPSDKAAAIDLFMRLKSENIRLDGDAIKRWLVRNNWRPKDGEEVKELIEAINAGRTVRGRQSVWREDIIAQFRERSEHAEKDT